MVLRGLCGLQGTFLYVAFNINATQIFKEYLEDVN